MVKLSIIILTYNSEKYIDPLIQSLNKKYSEQLKRKEIEIIIADNESLDGTLNKAQKYKDDVKIISNGGNFGYAKGNNLAFKKANGEYILFLNPDAKLYHGDLLEVLNLFDDEKVGVVGGRIISLDGKKELSCGKFYNPFNTLMLALGLENVIGLRFSPEREKKVDFVSGGFMFVRRKVFESINGFDENYFMYIEDSDLCYQVRKRGFVVKFSPKATIQHVGQGSSNRTFAIVNIYKGLLYFNKKNLGSVARLIVKIILSIKAILLVLVGKIMNNKYLETTYNEALKGISK